LQRIEKTQTQDADPCQGWDKAGLPHATDHFFPAGVLGCNEVIRDWYVKVLTALDEPSLWELSKKDPQARVYRFLWLRSFHDPLAIRLVINHDLTGLAITKVGDVKIGYPDPGRLSRSETRAVGTHGTSLLLTRVIATDFWALRSGGTLSGLDGADWILEAVADGAYKVVVRWSPGDRDPIYVLGMTLASDVAGLKLGRDEVY
jgi:hypothetical protein